MFRVYSPSDLHENALRMVIIIALIILTAEADRETVVFPHVTTPSNFSHDGRHSMVTQIRWTG